jgi:Tol biopolymer transport system component
LSTDEWSEYENFEHLDRRNDIFIGHLNTGLIHRKLTEDGGFDGFPAFSADNKTVYYTSMAINGTVGAAAAQIWSMNAEDGSNKKQVCQQT